MLKYFLLSYTYSSPYRYILLFSYKSNNREYDNYIIFRDVCFVLSFFGTLTMRLGSGYRVLLVCFEASIEKRKK